MPDTSAATITIGGQITTVKALEDLVEAIAQEAGPDWPGSFASSDEILEHIQAAAGEGEPVSVFNNEASWGIFEQIEGVCKEHGLDFVRSDDGHYAYPATHTAFKGGQEFEAAGATDQGPCIDLRHLARIAEDYGPETLAEQVLSLQRAFSKPASIEIDAAILPHVETENKGTQAL